MNIEHESSDYLQLKLRLAAVEAENLALRKMVEENRARGSQFLGNLSHEIRTPLTGIVGMTHLALQLGTDTVQRNYLQTLEASAHAMMVVVNDVFDFSKIEAGQLELKNEPFDLMQVTQQTIASFEPRFAKKGLHLVGDLGAAGPLAVRGDSGRIRQILTNLCDNALKFTDRGRVTVRLKRLPNEANSANEPADSVTPCARFELSVSDSGLGIASDQQKQIFEAFRQVDASSTRKVSGAGLGLAITARLVALMDGKIWVDSETGRGSTFHVVLKLALGSANAAAPAKVERRSAAPIKRETRQLNVLFAEDNPISQMLITVLLKRLGHHVVLAENGQKAVELFESGPWDIALMDIQMPVLNGLDATRQIRTLEDARSQGGKVPQQRLPIVAITANASEEDQKACLAAGMNGHLAKPFHPDLLRETMERYCPS